MDDAIEAPAFLPAAAGSHLSEDFTAVSYGRNKGCGKGNDRFPCKIIIFYEIMNRPGRLLPPDGKMVGKNSFFHHPCFQFNQS